jgi:spermidine synthase
VAAAACLGGCTQAEPVLLADPPAREAPAPLGARGPAFVEGQAQLLEIASDYSRIRVKQEGSLRTLWFVEDDGHEVKETAIDLARPHELVIPYTRAMFVSHLLLSRPPERCLLVGLGGGAMVRFLEQHFPSTEIDAVEIDPVVVQIADEWFGTRPGPRIRIATRDGFLYVKEALEARTRWDVVYMDAFLKPAEDTDSRGQQLRLKTQRFLAQLGRLLSEGGCVVFNMLRGPELEADIRTVGQVFPYVRVITGWGGNVVVAASFTPPPSVSELERRADALDEQGLGFSFVDLARSLLQGG